MHERVSFCHASQGCWHTIELFFDGEDLAPVDVENSVFGLYVGPVFPLFECLFLPCDTRLLRIAAESIFSAALQKFGGHGQVKVVRVTTPDREPIVKGVFGEPLFELKKPFRLRYPAKSSDRCWQQNPSTHKVLKNDFGISTNIYFNFKLECGRVSPMYERVEMAETKSFEVVVVVVAADTITYTATPE